VAADLAPAFGILTALPEEFHAMRALVEDPEPVPVEGDWADYVVGTVPSRVPDRPHAVVVTLMGDTANSPAAADTTNLLRSFGSVQCVIMTGIAAGVPDPSGPARHVRLGDIVVAAWGAVSYAHVVVTDGTSRLREPFPPPWGPLLRASRFLTANEWAGDRPWERWLDADAVGLPDEFRRPPARTDVLQGTDGHGRPRRHPKQSRRRAGWPMVHHGAIGSADQSIRDPKVRDRIAREHDLLALEMEAVGVGSAARLAGRGWFMVRGVSDYGEVAPDGQGGLPDRWRPYASLAAAGYVRALLGACLPVPGSGSAPPARQAGPPDPGTTADDGRLEERLVAPSRQSLTEPSRLVIPIQRRTSLDTAFLPAVRAAVENPAVVAIYAEAGLGKSVLLGQLYDDLAADLTLGLVLISASAKVRDHPSDPGELDRQLGLAVGRAEPLTAILDRQRRAGLRPVVLLDTLDVILDATSQPVLATFLYQLIVGGVPVVMTCRDFEYRTYLDPLPERAPLLAPLVDPKPIYRLKEPEVRTFALAYLTGNRTMTPTAAEGFVDRLLHLRSRRRAVVEICGSPLLLRLVCQIYGDAEVPEDLTVARLYEQYWNQYVRDDPRRPVGGSTAAGRDRICRAGARLLRAASTTAFTEEFDPAELDLGADDALEGLQSAGVLVPGADPSRLRFFHQTLAEYAMARDLSADPIERAVFLATLHDASRGSHLWQVLLQLLYTLPDGEPYQAAVAALDLSDQFALRAAALSAVDRRGPAVLTQLMKRARTLSGDHQRHVVEALGAAGEAGIDDAIGRLAEAIEWLDERVVFAGATVLGRLISRHTGDRTAAIQAAVGSVVGRRSTLDDERREHLTAALLQALTEPSQPYRDAELGAIRESYQDLGPLGRAEVVRLFEWAQVQARAQLLTVALRYEAPHAARAELIDLVHTVLTMTPPDKRSVWADWQGMLGRTYAQSWDDVQIAVVVRLFGAAHASPELFGQLLDLAQGTDKPLPQRALHVAERVAEQLPGQAVTALLALPTPPDARRVGLVRTVLSSLPVLDRADAARVLDWLLPALPTQPLAMLQGAAHAAAGHADLLAGVLDLAREHAERLGRDLDRVVVAVLDGCAPGDTPQLIDALQATVPALRPDTRARVLGTLAPVDETARRLSLELALGRAATHARSAARRAVSMAIDLGWFDPAYAASLLQATVPGVIAETARWIRHNQAGLSPLATELAAAVTAALTHTGSAPVARSLLEVVEADVRADGPAQAHLAGLVDTLTSRATASTGHSSIDRDLGRTLGVGVLILLRHAVDTWPADSVAPALMTAFTTLPLDDLDEAADHVSRLLILAERHARTEHPSALNQLLDRLSRLPSTLQLGVAMAAHAIHGEQSATFRGLASRTADQRVHAYLARRLTA
jgi:nucleoside phosphorylase